MDRGGLLTQSFSLRIVEGAFQSMQPRATTMKGRSIIAAREGKVGGCCVLVGTMWGA